MSDVPDPRALRTATPIITPHSFRGFDPEGYDVIPSSIPGVLPDSPASPDIILIDEAGEE